MSRRARVGVRRRTWKYVEETRPEAQRGQARKGRGLSKPCGRIGKIFYSFQPQKVIDSNVYNSVQGGHMKLSVRILIGVVTSLFLFTAIAVPASAASVKIGFVFSMTGGAAVYGTSQKEGATLAIDQINAAAGSSGLQIAPVWEDDASVPQQGTNVFNKLINGDKVSLIIGPTLSNTAKITDPIAQKAGVPVLAISNTIAGITEIGDFIFRNSLTENVVIPHTVKVAKEKLGLKKVAMLYGNDDAMTKATYDVFKKELAAAGIQILERTGLRQGRPRLFTAAHPDQVSKP